MSEAGAGPEERLAALGLVLPQVTPPLAAYVPGRPHRRPTSTRPASFRWWTGS